MRNLNLLERVGFRLTENLSAFHDAVVALDA